MKKRRRKDPFWDTTREEELIGLLLEEAKLLREQRGDKKISLTELIKIIMRKYREYQNYSLIQVYWRVMEMKRTSNSKRKKHFRQLYLILAEIRKRQVWEIDRFYLN